MTISIQRYAVIVIQGDIRALTGLRIGGSNNNFSIGGNDNPVIRDPLTQQPYIPGSSLRGKMRSLTEKYYGLPLTALGQIRLHLVKSQEEYDQSPVANIYGISADKFGMPTRLLVRDVPLTPESVKALSSARTDAPFTELKSEVTIDRITSQANPRTMERVPAGAIFGPMELVYSVYQRRDLEVFFKDVLQGLALVEDDYLGGGGSRGSGKVQFANLRLTLKVAQDNETIGAEYPLLADLLTEQNSIIQTAIAKIQQISQTF